MKKITYLCIVFFFMEITVAFAQEPSSSNTIDRLEDKIAFTISPNPAKERLNIELNPKIRSARLQVFDVLGKRIVNKQISDINSNVNVSNWNNGIYIVRIISGDTSETKRFVKQ